MALLPPDISGSPPSRDDLRRLEARLDSRLQEVNARIVLHDGRFAAMGDRVNQSERRSDALSARIDSRLRSIDSRLRSIDRRFDGVGNRLDHADDRLQETRDSLHDDILVSRRRWWKRRRSGT